MNTNKRNYCTAHVQPNQVCRSHATFSVINWPNSVSAYDTRQEDTTNSLILLLLLDSCTTDGKRIITRISTINVNDTVPCSQLPPSSCTHWVSCINSLSLLGRVFFSWVSVFFSFDLSKVVTSEMSGLSAMAPAGRRAHESQLSNTHIRQSQTYW